MKRILTAIVLIAVVVTLILLGKLWMVTVMAAVVAVLAAIEFRSISGASNSPIPLWWTLAAVPLFFYVTFHLPEDTITVVAFAMLLLFVWNVLRTPVERVLGETASGLLLLLYVAYPLTLIPRLRAMEHGAALVLFLFLCVWSGDIAALYIGKKYGRKKLAPTLSPNKTWAGATASIVASIGFGMLLIGAGYWLANSSLGYTRLYTSAPWWEWVLLAALLNIAAQFGDLLESALKRGAGVKDSGTMLPGHGGILDRIDALLLAAPVLWFVVVIKEFFSLGGF